MVRLALASWLGCSSPSTAPSDGAPPTVSTPPPTAMPSPRPPPESCPEGCCNYTVDCPSSVLLPLEFDGAIGRIDASFPIAWRMPTGTAWCPGTTVPEVTIPGVTGEVVREGPLEGRFVPDAWLEPSTTYTVEVEHVEWCHGGSMCVWTCEGEQTATFSTRDVIPADALVGRAYALPWADFTWSAPADPAAFLALVPFDALVFAIDASDDPRGVASGRVLSASGAPLEPVCRPGPTAIDLAVNPGLTTLDAVAVAWGEEHAILEALSIDGTLTPDGAALESVSVRARIAPHHLIAGATCDDAAIQAIAPTCAPCSTSATGCVEVRGALALAAATPWPDCP